MITLERAPIPRQVRLANMAYRPAQRPAPYRRPALRQVEVSPDITVEAPVEVDLGSLPVIVGSLLAGGASFLVGSQVPKARIITTPLGIGLIGFGIINVFLAPSKAEAAEDPGTIAPPTPGDISPPLPTTSIAAFDAVTGRVIDPIAGTIIDAGLFAPTIPVRARLSNPSNDSVTFDLILDVDEQPNWGGAQNQRKSSRVTLGAGETRDVDVEFTMVTWSDIVSNANVTVWIGKQPLEGGDVTYLDSNRFEVD